MKIKYGILALAVVLSFVSVVMGEEEQNNSINLTSIVENNKIIPILINGEKFFVPNRDRIASEELISPSGMIVILDINGEQVEVSNKDRIPAKVKATFDEKNIEIDINGELVLVPNKDGLRYEGDIYECLCSCSIVD